MIDFGSFIHLVFIAFIALFPVVNPLGSAFIVNPYFDRLSPGERRQAVKRVVLYAFVICTVTMLVGHWILALFGLTIPVIQLAGGIMICKIGWDFLSTDSPDRVGVDSSKVVVAAEDSDTTSYVEGVKTKLFYPITFPMTTGAGTISVLFTLTAHSDSGHIGQYFFNLGAVLLAICALCALVYLTYSNADKLIRVMGSNIEKIINRLMAFLIFCVGLQIAVGGISTLSKGLL